MRARDYIDDVKLRLMRNDVMQDLDDAMVMTCVNRARRKVQVITMTFVPERYGNQVTIAPPLTTTDGLRRYLLPDDCLDVYAAYFMYNETVDGDVITTEMRQVENRELVTTINHSFNRPTLEYPIYTVYYGLDSVFTGDILEMSFGDTTLTGNIEQIYVYYIAALDDLEYLNGSSVDDDDTVMPSEYDELVVLYAVLYCLQIMQEEVAKMSIEAEIAFVEKGLKIEYEKKQRRISVFLPSKKGI